MISAILPIEEKKNFLAVYMHRKRIAMTEMASETGVDLFSLTDFMKGTHELSKEDEKKVDEFIASQSS